MGRLDKHYDEVVAKTWNYSGKVKDSHDEFMNAVLGLAGEAGEIADFHKKFFYHTGKSENLDAARHELLLEFGDLTYYYNKLRKLWGFSVEEIVEANKEKLMKRHPETFKE
jgi:NTP pyrophosphatase (non-canonical NTP hydrolase)